MSDEAPSAPPRHSTGKRAAGAIAAVVLVWAALAYFVMPADWRWYARRHPSLDDVPGITQTASHIPADPLNVALVGTKRELIKAMLAAGWHPADPLSLKSCLEISEATILKRPYEDAPVSSLYLFGRKEDLAFEKLVGGNPRERNHVRFWLSPKLDSDGRPFWFGAATFDKGVGLSHTTGQITHHTARDIDVERDTLFADLKAVPGLMSEFYIERGFHKVLEGRNGEGDPWKTDGDLYVGVLAAE